MQADSETVPIEYVEGPYVELIVDSAEDIAESFEEKGPGSTWGVGHAMDSAKVDVAMGPQENCCLGEAHSDSSQREKEMTSVFVGGGSGEELDLNARGMVPEYANKEPNPETGHQWVKEEPHLEIGLAQAGVLDYCSNGVLAVYYANKSSVIQLLGACDRDVQPGLFLCLEDTTETVICNNSLCVGSISTLTDKGQFNATFNCSNEFDQLQVDQELEEIPRELSDFCSDQSRVPILHVERRRRKNRRRSTVPNVRIVIPRLSGEEIRITVYRSFQELLMLRLQEADDLDISEETVQALATDIEKELFLLFFCTNSRYKNKYRSLMFNLKDPRNMQLFRQVLLGEITPQRLVLMSPTELASLELMEWRKRENKHSMKLITAESDKFEKQPLSKLTHKGEIEIERDLDQNLTLEDLMENSPKPSGNGELSESGRSNIVDTTHQHRSHLLDPNCRICTALQVPPVKSKLSWAPDNLANEITFLQSKHFSPIEDTAGLSNLTKCPAASKRFRPQAHAVWKGFMQMSNMKRFLVKAYPVLGHTDHLTKVLSTTITVARCVLPEAIWDSVDRLPISGTKEMCVVRFKPSSRKDVCLYSLYYSYLNSRQRYGAVVLEQGSPKTVYLIPLPALQKAPSRLPPLSGPGLESSHPDLLLALAFPKKQHSSSASRKSYECRRGPDRCLQEKKSRQKCIEDIDTEHLSDHSQFSPCLGEHRAQPCILPMLPSMPFTQPREFLHHSCPVKPPDLLLGDLLSSEEHFHYTDLPSNFADEMLQSYEEQESDVIESMFGASAFTDDGQNQYFDINEQHHGDDAGKEDESTTRNENLNIETKPIDHFEPAGTLPENLLSVTQLNSVLQQENESYDSTNILTTEQDNWAAGTQYTEDMQSYIKELDKLFTNVPLGTLSQHEDCRQLRSTISCCAGVLNHLLSTSTNSLTSEVQIPMGPHGNLNSTMESQESSQHTTRFDSPLPLLTPQMPSNVQHLGYNGTMTLDSGVPFNALLANEETRQQAEVPFHIGAKPLSFRFQSSHQRGIASEIHQLPGQHVLSPYCTTQCNHCTNVHIDIGQGPTTFTGVP
ncbi:PHD finger protein 3-like [Scyliorhinus canicula]|uniref:PHD finger protein 3-like n=1 Tax=Scyliorhinus canicula TaxID=7830 RepID=UPI0018F400C3|nr:PHD finger protein 3-like [Scyliorhinus canicula]